MVHGSGTTGTRRTAALRAWAALALALCAGCASGAATLTEDRRWVELEAPVVLDQLVHSPMSCGPAALATALVAEGGAAGRRVAELGDGAVAHAVEAYGTRAPVDGVGETRFDPATGVSPRNLLAWTNDWRADLGLAPLVGVFLDRLAGEDDRAHCARVHAVLRDALASGVAPVLRVRSFAPSWYPRAGQYRWDGVAAHWVVLLGVPAELADDGLGFEFVYADPDGGAVERGWAAVETQRDFVAAKGDANRWVWVDERPFLLVDAPGLRSLGRQPQPWFLRTVVTLDHALVPPRVLAPGMAERIEADAAGGGERGRDGADGADGADGTDGDDPAPARP